MTAAVVTHSPQAQLEENLRAFGGVEFTPEMAEDIDEVYREFRDPSKTS